MNVQHLESLNDQVCHVTGMRVRETMPDWVVDEADEVVLRGPDAARAAQPPGARRGLCAGKGAARDGEFLHRDQPHRAARNGHAPHRARSGRQAARPAGRRIRGRPGAPRADADLPHRAAVFGHSDSPRKARGRLLASRLPGDSRGAARSGESGSRSRSRGAPHELRAQPAHRDAHCGSRGHSARHHRVRPRPADHANLHGTLPPPPWWKRFRYTIVQQVVRQARDMQITIVAERRR